MDFWGPFISPIRQSIAIDAKPYASKRVSPFFCCSNSIIAIDAPSMALLISASAEKVTKSVLVSAVGRSGIPRAFWSFGVMQCTPFLTLTTWETRQSETEGINLAAASALMPLCSLMNLTVCDFAPSKLRFKSRSNPTVIQLLSVSMRGMSSFLFFKTSIETLNSL